MEKSKGPIQAVNKTGEQFHKDKLEGKYISKRVANFPGNFLQTCQDSSPLKVYKTFLSFTSGITVMFSS